MDALRANTLKEDRPISTDEAAIVSWMILHASVAGSLGHLASSVPALRVVGRCSCGCGSVDFEVDGQTLPFQPIADGTGQNSDGLEIGVVLWGRHDLITGLEFYDMTGATASLPLVSTLQAW
jgi:hypothetical protein